jgi:hypothetical protein
MSRQNLEIVEAAFNAYYSGDSERQMFADEGTALAAVGRDPAISPLVRAP